VSGYILLHRKINDSFQKREKYCSKMAWIDLLLLANYKDGFFYVRDVKVKIKRGQVGWSEYQLAARWMWSRGRVRRFLTELQNEQRIVLQKTPVTTIITISKYDQYQSCGTTDDTADSTTGGTTGGTTDGTQRIKEELKKKQKEPPVVPRGDDGKIPFSDFIKAYPSRNGGKGYNPKTEAKWKKMTKGEQHAALDSLQLFRECHDWTKENGQYIPMVSTFINQERWRTPPTPDAPLLQGWRVCSSCGGRGCEVCNQKGKVKHGITA
jgi:hypothetical protein